MAALEKFDAWLTRLCRFWSARVDALERYLDHLDHKEQLTQKNRKAK